MMILDLPEDLGEEILSRVPFKDLRAVRSTCKKWNVLSKTRSFVNKHMDKAAISGEKEFLVITEFSVSLIGVNLHRDQNKNVDLSIKRKARLVSRGRPKEVFCNSQIIHCNGVFLCLWGHMLVVLNPYWGQTKWIMPSPPVGMLDMYALGYDKSCGSHKILRLFGYNRRNLSIYDLSSNSNSWMVLDDTLEPDIKYLQDGVSLKGDTYWYAKDQESRDGYLICFDFTSERFGPHLPLPFNEDFPAYAGYVTLSSVKEEKLAVLLRLWDTMDIWVTNKIEPDAVSWSIFLKVDMKQSFHFGNFFIDEEKKVAVFYYSDRSGNRFNTIYNRAYIIGENGYFRDVDLSESPNATLGGRLVCSYIPSSIKIM